MVALLGAGAMGVDMGFLDVGSRTAQAVADTAAMDLIQYINVADQQATMAGVQNYLDNEVPGVLTDNSSNAQLNVTPMLYQNGTYTIPSAGCQDTVPFNPAVPACNAVAVTAKQPTPQPFWGPDNLVTRGGSGLPVGSGCGTTTSGGCGMGCSNNPCFSCPTGGCTSCPTTACSVWQATSCFSIGSYLVSANAQQTTVLNDILKPLGTTANLTALGYQGLANTYVSLNQLITGSGTLLNASDVMTTSLTAAQWLTIFADAVNSQASSGPCSTGKTSQQDNASDALAKLDFGGSTSVELCQLVSVNGSSCANGSLSFSSLSAGVNVLQMLTTEAELANGSSGLDVTSALNVPGVTSAELFLNVIQPAQIAFGPVGSSTAASPCPATSGTSTCAETSQVSADLKLSVLGAGLLDIPLSGADGVATLSSITCANNAMTNTTINATTTTATAAITLASVAAATLTINGAPSTSESYGSSVVPPTASTISAGTNPRSLGVPVLTFSSLSPLSPVYTLLTSVLPGFYVPVLLAAGVSVGNADVADLGSNCDAFELAP
jgi:uncharacterized membrane protein